MNKDNKQASSLCGFLINCYQKRRKSIKISPSKQGNHPNTIYHSSLNIKKNIHFEPAFTKPHAQNFRNKLHLYLHQNERHSKNITQQIEKKGLNQSCEWLKIKKQDNQGDIKLKGRVFERRKNIKQYISQISVQKKKKYSIKSSVYNTVQSDSSESKSKNKNTSMLIIQNIDKMQNKKPTQQRRVQDRCIVISKLIPIHHTQVHFFEKQHRKQSNKLENQNNNNDTAISEINNSSQFCLFNKSLQININKTINQQNDFPQSHQQNNDQIFVRKHVYDQRLRLSEGNQPTEITQSQDFSSSREQKRRKQWRKLINPKKIQAVKQERQQNCQFGPWKRRKTIQSQCNL